MKFSKMHGAGNDYVYVNGFEETVPEPERTAIFVSDRHFGIGSDGLILILPSDTADCRMQMFNADGSEGMMCGNGIRCVGKYAYDHGIVHKKDISVETKSGLRHVSLHIENGTVTGADVDMGRAILAPEEIPVLATGDTYVKQAIDVDGQTYTVTCVSMGNPHCVVFTDQNVATIDLAKIGPSFEHHALFPEGINVTFANVLDSTTIVMRVWERGSGETLACGTAACATTVASVLNGYCRQDTKITVKLRGGTLHIVWHADGTVSLSGPAVHVFDGTIRLPWEK